MGRDFDGTGHAERVVVNGCALFTRVDGPQGAPWIVLSNSLASTYRIWDRQIDWLTQKYRVLRYDARGHGGSDVPKGPYTLDQLSSDALRLMDHHEIVRATFMGVSLGGITGLGIAIGAPERLERLVCCDARADAPPAYVDGWRQRIAKASSEGMTAIALETVPRWISTEFLRANPVAGQDLHQMISSIHVEGYVSAAQALLGLSYHGRLQDITTPTRFLVGELDAAIPPSVMTGMSAAVEGSELVILEGSAHLPNIDNAPAFNERLSSFLDL